jgi:hypothetical protein
MEAATAWTFIDADFACLSGAPRVPYFVNALGGLVARQLVAQFGVDKVRGGQTYSTSGPESQLR